MFRTNYSKVIVSGLSVMIALLTLRFIPLGLETAFPEMIAHIQQRELVFITHIVGASFALSFGVFQFFERFRANGSIIHRWNGRVYAVAILFSGIAGLVMAAGSYERPMAAYGFGLLAILWIATTARAVIFARKRKIGQHRRWMIYSFALTFAAVTLRLQLPIFLFVFEMPYSQASNYVAWTCWVPNIVFAYWYLNRKK